MTPLTRPPMPQAPPGYAYRLAPDGQSLILTIAPPEPPPAPEVQEPPPGTLAWHQRQRAAAMAAAPDVRNNARKRCDDARDAMVAAAQKQFGRAPSVEAYDQDPRLVPLFNSMENTESAYISRPSAAAWGVFMEAFQRWFAAATIGWPTADAYREQLRREQGGQPSWAR